MLIAPNLLCSFVDLCERQFEAAMAAKDSAGVSRFAKLFHPLGHLIWMLETREVLFIYIVVFLLVRRGFTWKCWVVRSDCECWVKNGERFALTSCNGAISFPSTLVPAATRPFPFFWTFQCLRSTQPTSQATPEVLPVKVCRNMWSVAPQRRFFVFSPKVAVKVLVFYRA